MKKLVSLMLALVLMVFTVSSITAFAAQIPSVSSDTAKTLSIEQGKNYIFKFTISGASTLSVAVGNSAVIKASAKKSGNAYLVTIMGVNEGSTGIYTTLPGQKGICQCIVTVQSEKIGFGYQNSDYGCGASHEQLTYVLSHANVVGSSKYNSTYSTWESNQSSFESMIGVPYSEEWNKIVSIMSCFSGGTGSGSAGSAYAYFTGANWMCADKAKAMEAALHDAGYNARLAGGTRNGASHMWVQLYKDGSWWNLDGKIGTSVNAGYVLKVTGYNL